VRVLLLVFEWGKQRIRRYEKDQPKQEVDASDGDEQASESMITREDVARKKSHRLVIENQRSLEDMQRGFVITDAMYFVKNGIEVIIEDEVTQRFDAEELSSWNLLTRTNRHYEFISWRLSLLWVLGCILRLFILFPFRLVIALFAVSMLLIGTAIIGYFPDGRVKRRCYYRLCLTSFRIFSRAFSAVVRFHNRENKAAGGGICVANHTSPIDIIILGCDNCYAMVGQMQGGFFGVMQRAMLRAEHHIWFQRSETKDRLAVTRRLREHIDDTKKLPILIFPEGTCINNTSIMMFKKGSFEVGGTIYPVAIKYDSRFADPFWNSSKQNLTRHLLNILTSWALVCDVWYLPPEHQKEEEDVFQFTNRVKATIAQRGGLVDLDWDGSLKREKPKDSFLQLKQQEYSRLLLAEDHRD